MYGLLIPCGGGKPIVLRRPHLLVGRRLEYAPDDGTLPPCSRLHCELVCDEQGWCVRTFHGSRGMRVRVNGVRVESQRLESGDVLVLAGRRYRIEFTRRNGAPCAEGASDAHADGSPDDAGMRFDPPRGLLIPRGEGNAFPLAKPTVILGSAHDADLVLPGLLVAPYHCRLDFANGWWRATDVSHGLGMRVDNVPVQEHWLSSGEVLMISTFHYALHFPVTSARGPDVRA